MVRSGDLELERLGGIGEAREAWATLAAPAQSPFATIEWAEAWLEHASHGAEPIVFLASERGEPRAIVPLVLNRGRYVRKVRFLGFGAANELGPVGTRCDEALRLALAAIPGAWDIFLGESLPGEGWAARLGAERVGLEGSPVARGPWASWEDYLATRSRNLRKELGQKERRLGEHLRYRTVATREELGPGLDALFELHRARWGEDASPFFSGEEQFHRAFAATAFERGWLRLRLLELDARPAAANLSYRVGELDWSYQGGRDPAHEDDSVGLLVFAHAIRTAIEEGAREFKLGPGLQDYKRRFATCDEGLETVGLARGVRGRLSLLTARRRGRWRGTRS